ncbi:uncharacterized protein LOC142982712 [Anticarsia gemmatalis]|uniref:uncharacterized protein LOC142982712 n=1 Tax=Anticarsia gemmatalis TaxID=129554 RepID=UPI003F7773FF
MGYTEIGLVVTATVLLCHYGSGIAEVLIFLVQTIILTKQIITDDNTNDKILSRNIKESLKHSPSKESEIDNTTSKKENKSRKGLSKLWTDFTGISTKVKASKPKTSKRQESSTVSNQLVDDLKPPPVPKRSTSKTNQDIRTESSTSAIQANSYDIPKPPVPVNPLRHPHIQAPAIVSRNTLQGTTDNGSPSPPLPHKDTSDTKPELPPKKPQGFKPSSDNRILVPPVPGLSDKWTVVTGLPSTSNSPKSIKKSIEIDSDESSDVFFSPTQKPAVPPKDYFDFSTDLNGSPTSLNGVENRLLSPGSVCATAKPRVVETSDGLKEALSSTLSKPLRPPVPPKKTSQAREEFHNDNNEVKSTMEMSLTDRVQPLTNDVSTLAQKRTKDLPKVPPRPSKDTKLDRQAETPILPTPAQRSLQTRDKENIQDIPHSVEDRPALPPKDYMTPFSEPNETSVPSYMTQKQPVCHENVLPPVRPRRLHESLDKMAESSNDKKDKNVEELYSTIFKNKSRATALLPPKDYLDSSDCVLTDTEKQLSEKYFKPPAMSKEDEIPAPNYKLSANYIKFPRVPQESQIPSPAIPPRATKRSIDANDENTTQSLPTFPKDSLEPALNNEVYYEHEVNSFNYLMEKRIKDSKTESSAYPDSPRRVNGVRVLPDAFGMLPMISQELLQPSKPKPQVIVKSKELKNTFETTELYKEDPGFSEVSRPIGTTKAFVKTPGGPFGIKVLPKVPVIKPFKNTESKTLSKKNPHREYFEPLRRAQEYNTRSDMPRLNSEEMGTSILPSDSTEQLTKRSNASILKAFFESEVSSNDGTESSWRGYSGAVSQDEDRAAAVPRPTMRTAPQPSQRPSLRPKTVDQFL